MMEMIREVHGDQRGLVGKLIIVWLLLAALIAVAAVDTVSITLSRFKLSDTATEAASDGAVDFRKSHDVTAACSAAATTVQTLQPEVKLGKNFCHVDPGTGYVTITLHATARTVLAGRLEFSKKYATVTQSETNGPSEV